MTRADGPPPVRFQVLGERSSGTNLLKRLLGRNSALEPTEALGWKHGFLQALAVPADLAVICTVRNPADWALSMHAKPWHGTHDLQRLPFAEFIRAPWDTVIDRPRYFGGAAAAGILGQPLQQDRDPVTGARFPDLFALRTAKLRFLLGFLARDCNCVLIRTELVQADPQAAVDRLLAALDQPPRGTAFRPVQKRLGARFTAAVAERPATPAAMSAADRDFMRAALDLALEARLGYAA